MNIEYGSATFTLIWVFGWAIFVLVIWYLRGQRRERRIDRIHKERMAALERGLPLPELPGYDDKGIEVQIDNGASPQRRAKWAPHHTAA